MRMMTDNENEWDKLLHIKTSGRDDSNSDAYRYPYEPTPYCVLERLANSGIFRKGDVVLDYGCGKGRVSFFLSYQTKAKTIGIEYDERIYARAKENLKTARAKADFAAMRAEEFDVPPDVNRCYFFNPFSVEILRKVMEKIKESQDRDSREAFLFFYYPSQEYLAYLAEVEGLELYDEVACGDLFEGNDLRERVMVFQMKK